MELAKWCCKFARKCWFDQKGRSIIKIKKHWKVITLYKNGDLEVGKILPTQSPTSIYDVDVDGIIVSDRVPFGKKGSYWVRTC